MQSGKEPTLNLLHIGMIRGIISNNINVIKVCLAKLGNSSQQIIDYLNKAIETTISEEDEKKFLEKKVANESGLYKDLPIRCMQLSAIFNPNFNVLNEMGVINHVNDKECKITSEEFTTYKNLIRNFSIISLEKFIRRDKELSPLRKNIAILSNIESKDVDEEFERTLHKTK